MLSIKQALLRFIRTLPDDIKWPEFMKRLSEFRESYENARRLEESQPTPPS